MDSVYLNVKCNGRLTTTHPLITSRFLPFCNTKYGLSHSQSFSPLEALRNVRRPHTQVDYITGNI